MATGPWGPGIGDHRVFRVNIRWIQNSQRCQTGFHLRDLGVAGRTPEEVATEVVSFVNTTAWRQLFVVADQMDSVDVVNLTTKEGHTTVIPGVAGLNAGRANVSAVMFPLALIGGLRVRYANGRMMWPLRAVEGSNGDDLSTPQLGLVQAAIDEMADRWIDGGVGAELGLVHLHDAKPERPKKPSGTLPAVPATWYDVTAIRVQRRISWLTRRKAGVGS